MAWAISLDGVNDYLTIASTKLHTESGRTTFEYEIYAAPDADQTTFRVVGNAGSFTGQMSITPSRVEIRLGGAGASQVNINYTQVFDGLYHTYKIRRDGNNYSFLIDGVSVATTTSAAATGNNGVVYIGRVSGNYAHANIGYIIFRDSIGGTDLFNWDATASSHAAGTPILTETVAANNATGVNMPTDGSAWIDLGGSGISIVGDTALFDFNALAGTVDLTGEILVAGSTASFDYTAISGAVDLTGQLLVTGDTANFDYSAISGDVEFTGEISVTGDTASFDYVALPGSIDLTGEIIVTGSTANFDHTGENGIVELGAVINVVGQTANFDFNGVDAEVSLAGEIIIIGDTATFNYQALSGLVVIGQGQKIGTVTAGFAESIIGVQYKQSTITVNFGE